MTPEELKAYLRALVGEKQMALLDKMNDANADATRNEMNKLFAIYIIAINALDNHKPQG